MSKCKMGYHFDKLILILSRRLICFVPNGLSQGGVSLSSGFKSYLIYGRSQDVQNSARRLIMLFQDPPRPPNLPQNIRREVSIAQPPLSSIFKVMLFLSTPLRHTGGAEVQFHLFFTPRPHYPPGKYRGRVQTECDGTRAETRFGLPAKRTSPFISASVSVQSSTGFLGVRVGRERL